MLSISNNKQTILKDGKPFFYLADTCWSAFTNITDEEWEFYLYQRKTQGFNALQINILPQWDASDTDLRYFHKNNDSWYDLNDEYFEHAKKMCIKAKEMGFELALVLLWCNFVPGTWGAKMFETDIMPFDAIENYVHKVHKTFTDLEPIYVISGDTDFDTDETIAYYVKGGSLLKKLAPECLFTCHIKGKYTFIPEELQNLMDLYFYQSGHNPKDKTTPYTIGEAIQRLYPGKPVINSEPCYEEMGYSGKKNYGRWTRADVRRAAYQSILSGSCAGVTYGAAGIYSWHKVNKGFMTGLGEAFDMPKSWEQAVFFPGAWDYGYLKNIMESLQAYNLAPRQDLLINDTQEIRVACIDDARLIVYVPHNTKVKLKMDLTGWHVKAIGLDNRYISNLNFVSNEKMTVIELHPFHEDALYIIHKQNL